MADESTSMHDPSMSRLAAQLETDVRKVYDVGFSPEISHEDVPALAGLATALLPEAVDLTVHEAIEALLRRGIAQTHDEGRKKLPDETFHTGLEKWLGVGNDEPLGIDTRRHLALRGLGFSTTESLANGKRKRDGVWVEVETLLRRQLVTALLALAADVGFEYVDRPAPSGASSVEAPEAETETLPVDVGPVPATPVDTQRASADEASVAVTPGPRRWVRRHRGQIVVGAILAAVAVLAVLSPWTGDKPPDHPSKPRKIAQTGPATTPLASMPESYFYPDRPTYDYNKFDPRNLNCDDPKNVATQHGRCGANKPVLNSFVNTPEYGDERAFLDGRRSDQPKRSTTNFIQNVDSGSRQVVLRIYVNNNAALDDAHPGRSTLHHVRVRVFLPTGTRQALRARAYISASNAPEVEDTVDMAGSRPFRLRYVPGSAVLFRNDNPYRLSDGIVGHAGAPIGLLTMNGELPAGNHFETAAVVELHVRVIVSQAKPVSQKPALDIRHDVRLRHTPTWGQEAYVHPGDTIEWQITTTNVGPTPLTHVVVGDGLPRHLQLVPDSVRFSEPGNRATFNNHSLFRYGYTISRYAPGDYSRITYKTTALGDFAGCATRLWSKSYTYATQVKARTTSQADVVIIKPNCRG